MPPSAKPQTNESRFNAVKHGCCSKSPVLPGEDEAHWREVEQDWFDEYQPDTPVRRALVAEVALAFWHMARNRRRLEQCDRSLSEKEPLAWTEQDHGNYSRFLRYKTAAERAFHTAFKNVEYFRKARLSEAEALRRVEWAYEQWQLKESRELAKIELEQARLDLEVRAFEKLEQLKETPHPAPPETREADLRKRLRQQNEKRRSSEDQPPDKNFS